MLQKIVLFLAFSLLFIKVNAHPGIGIVLDSKGNVYYTDLEHVWRISPDGNRTIAVRDVHTHELYIDTNDNLFGEHEWYEGETTDKWGNYVWSLRNDGRLEKTIDDVEGFLDNTTLIRDSSQNSYWIKKQGNHDLLMQQLPNGENTLFSAHRFNDLRWLYYSNHDNNIYAVDYLEVKKISPLGNVTTIANNLKEEGFRFNKVADRHYVFGLWTNKNNEVFVALYGAGKVVKLTSEGKVIPVHESSTGWAPCGGIAEPDGSMWIMEFSILNKTRVLKITPEGDKTIFD